MKLKYIIFLLSIFVVTNIFGQKTNLHSYFEGREMTSLFVATNLQEASVGLEKLLETFKNEKEISLQTTSDFSSADTLYEIIKVDTCIACFYYDKYIINISKGLSIETYFRMTEYAKQISFRNHYIDRLLYGSILYELRSLTANHLMRDTNLKKSKEEMNSFLEKLVILSIDNWSIDVFSTDYYCENFISDAVCKAAIKQLKDPKFPSYLLEQYMQDNRHRWDPALIDTTGVLRKYLNIEFLTCLPSDTICEKYNKFRYYDSVAKEKGVTPEEALCQSVESEFYYKGFKRFSYLIDYAIYKNDTRLLPSIKEFVRDNPDYKLTDKQKAYFNKKKE